MKIQKTRIFLTMLLCVITGIVCFSMGCSTAARRTRIPYSSWPQAHFKDIRILIASEMMYANQGFAGAKEEDFENTIMLFPGIAPGTVFINRDQGYGKVIKDLKIIYLDEKMNILREDIMGKGDGYSIAPPGTFLVIEGLPPLTEQNP